MKNLIKKLVFSNKIPKTMDKTFLVKDKKALISNLEENIVIHKVFGLQDGVYTALFNKTIYKTTDYAMLPDEEGKKLALVMNARNFVLHLEEIHKFLASKIKGDPFYLNYETIYFDAEMGVTVASDGHSLRILPLENLEDSFYLQKMNLKKLKYLINYFKTEMVRVYKSKRYIIIDAINFTYYIRNSALARYPDYKVFIPDSQELKIEIPDFKGLKKELKEFKKYSKKEDIVIDLDNKVIEVQEEELRYERTFPIMVEEGIFKLNKRNTGKILTTAIDSTIELYIKHLLLFNSSILYTSKGQDSIFI